MSDGFGLEKNARLAAARQQVAAPTETAPLDPEFPYHVDPFPAAMLGVPAVPPATNNKP